MKFKTPSKLAGKRAVFINRCRRMTVCIEYCLPCLLSTSGGSFLALKSERLLTDTKSLVTVKGTKEGLLFLLDEHAAFEEIVMYLEQLLQGDNANLFSGPRVAVCVDYGSRELSSDQVNSILQQFLSKENFLLKEWGSRTNARQSLFVNRSRSVTQTIFKGTVRSGQQLMFQGDVVVIGDVNPGGEIHATGDIYVFGRLRGIAHAGMNGDEHAIVAAAEFAPMQLRIADVVSRAPEVNGRPLHTFMEFAYLREDGMAVEQMKYYPSLRQKRMDV